MAQVILVVAPAFAIFGYNQAGARPLATLQSWVKSSLKSIPSIPMVLPKRRIPLARRCYSCLPDWSLMGPLSCTFISDRLGRRKTIFCGAILTIVGQLLQVSAYPLIQFAVGRIILGMGVGQFSVAVPVWQSECSPTKNRGQHVITDGIFIYLGYTLYNRIDFRFSRLPHKATGQ